MYAGVNQQDLNSTKEGIIMKQPKVLPTMRTNEARRGQLSLYIAPSFNRPNQSALALIGSAAITFIGVIGSMLDNTADENTQAEDISGARPGSALWLFLNFDDDE